jgi:hypothetical protein
MAKRKIYFILALFLSSSILSMAQNSSGPTLSGQELNKRVITTAVPFLLIAPDARSGAMGDVGVAIEPDANSIHWNPAKMAFNKGDFGFSVNYTPWLGKIINDMNIGYLSGFYKLSNTQALTASLRYFDLGKINLTNDMAVEEGTYNPREWAADLGYSQKLGEGFGVGITGRFIHSNLTGQMISAGQDAQAGMSVAADVGVFYRTTLNTANESTLAFGGAITNLGAKLTYLNPEQADFIPTNLRLGTAYTTQLDQYNKLTVALDFNKLMVPSPPERDEQDRIIAGKNPNRPLLSGVFGSFLDAPGGFREEIREVTTGLGLEYWYNDLFAARAGYFHEHMTKGNRQFFTIGVGLRYQKAGFDFAYLVPIKQEHPLAETLRFSLVFNFAGE